MVHEVIGELAKAVEQCRRMLTGSAREHSTLLELRKFRNEDLLSFILAWWVI